MYGLGPFYLGVSVAVLPCNMGGGARIKALPISWSGEGSLLRVVVPKGAVGVRVLIANFGREPVDACITHIDGTIVWKHRRAELQAYTVVGSVILVSRAKYRTANLVVATIGGDNSNPRSLQLEVVPEELVTGSNPLIVPVLARSAAAT